MSVPRRPLPHLAAAIAAAHKPRQCDTCVYWWSMGDAGLCRRFPPIPGFPAGLGAEVVTVWPQTNHEEWCGEWRPTLDKESAS